MRFFEKLIGLFTGRQREPEGPKPSTVAVTQPTFVCLPVLAASKSAPVIEPETQLAKPSECEGSSAIAVPVESQASMSNPLHWLPTGLFLIQAVGESNYRSEIESLARNPAGTNALVFCTATLVPESTNIYDPNAVMVQIEGQKVAYLPREYAKSFRAYFDAFGLPLQTTTCDTAISNGLKTEDKQYSYSIELDIPLEPPRPTAMLPTYPAVTRRDTAPKFDKQQDGRYLVAVRLGHGVLEDMRDNVDSWTTDHWTVINYYVSNRKGLGLGHKLFEISKAKYAAMFGDFEPDASIESLIGRDAVIALRPTVLRPASEVAQRVKQYAFVLTVETPPLMAQNQWWEEESRLKLVREGVSFDKNYTWLLPFLPSDISSIEPILKELAWGPHHLSHVMSKIRELIRNRRRAKEPHNDLLLALYGVCAASDFTATLSFEGTPSTAMTEYVDARDLHDVAVDYRTMGYQFTEHLTEADVKWLVKTFGEPQSHQSFDSLWPTARRNAISRYCWEHARGNSSGNQVGGREPQPIAVYLNAMVQSKTDYRLKWLEKVAEQHAKWGKPAKSRVRKSA